MHSLTQSDWLADGLPLSCECSAGSSWAALEPVGHRIIGMSISTHIGIATLGVLVKAVLSLLAGVHHQNPHIKFTGLTHSITNKLAG